MNKPVLVIPVFRGGEFFREAIESIIPCLPWFSQCVISLNGVDTEEDKKTALRLKEHCQLTLLQTGRMLTSTQHGLYIAKAMTPKLRLGRKAQIFILCHDDLLSIEGFKQLDMEEWQSFGSDCVSLGDYWVFNDSNRFEAAAHRSSFAASKTTQKRSRQVFFDMQNTGVDPFTNVSGMRMSIDAFAKTLRYFVRTGSRTGMRMEYAYVLNKTVSSVISYSPPLVRIRSHPNSEGAQTSYADFFPSELRYLLWMWLNCRTPREIREISRGR